MLPLRIWYLLQRLRRDQRGQSMVEYSTIMAFGFVLGGTIWTLLGPQLLNAINAYLNSVYYMLNLPLP